MKSSDPNRRDFLKQSSTAAVAAGVVGGASATAADSKELEHWTQQIGSQYRMGDTDVVLRSVQATDHSADTSRPSSVRTQSLALLFAVESGRTSDNEQSYTLKCSPGNELHVNRVVAPKGETGQFFEAILS